MEMYGRLPELQMQCAQNKNHLVVDAFAADVVRDIYQWKLEGVSAADIAGRLNADGILAPMDYKRQQGLRFATPFRIRYVPRGAPPQCCGY